MAKFVRTTTTVGISVWLLTLLMLSMQQQTCECRYLPTRSHADDLDKLRELMLQILESSNEDQRPPNEANGNTLAQRASWLNKLGALDTAEARKYTSGGGHTFYENGRYY